jgi:hypothetical protein
MFSDQEQTESAFFDLGDNTALVCRAPCYSLPAILHFAGKLAFFLRKTL